MSLAAQTIFSAAVPRGMIEIGGAHVPRGFGEPAREYHALRHTVALIDLSFRSRVCLLGNDRKRFLHGQVTNNVNDLALGSGCYAALVTAKGRMQSDLFIYQLPTEILLDFEPGLTALVTQRLEQYIIADDVQVVDVSSQYGELSLQGPKAAEALEVPGLNLPLETAPLHFTTTNHADWGEIYCVNNARGAAAGFDLFVPLPMLSAFAAQLAAAVHKLDGSICGWDAMETVRIEAGLPRFGADMDHTNLAPEAGIDARAISYSKGCYIGQEVIARIRTYGQVAKALRGLRFSDGPLPKKDDKLFSGEKEVGYVTSAVLSPQLRAGIGLGYVRREHNQEGLDLRWRGSAGEGAARIVSIPFHSGM
jgi:folate-binding protein YgfZ